MKKLVRLLSRNAVCLFVFFVFVVASSFFSLLHVSSKQAIHGAHLQQLTVKPFHHQEDCLFHDNYHTQPYKSMDSYKTVRLVFYKKHKMNVAQIVARNKGWITTGIANKFNQLISYISSDSFTVIFTSSKELSSVMFERYLNKTNLLAAGIPGAYQFTGTKREQYLTYQAYLNSFGCSIEDLELMPLLYLLDDDQQCRQFFDRLERGGADKTWVLKNSRGFGGDQVEVIRNSSLLKARFGRCRSNEQFIAQEYIQSLLLLNNRKFDVRALVLIANSQPYMLFYHEGYLRVVIKTFDPKGSREVHLTNTHVQSLQPGFVPDEHFWSFERFQAYLDASHPDNGNFVQLRLIPFIKRISMLIVKSGWIE